MTIVVSPGTSEGGLSAIRTSIQVKGYGTDTATPVQNAMINSVYRRVVGMRRWWFLEVVNDTSLTLEAGANQVPIDIEDFLFLDAVRLSSGTDYIEIEHLPVQEFRNEQHNNQRSGEPIYWTRVNNRLHFWPTADKDYTVSLDYVKDPPDLAADDDITVLPAAFQDVLAWGAIKELCFRERDMDGRDIANDEYATILNNMVHQDGLEQRQTASEVTYSGEPDLVNRNIPNWLT